jgi:predicted nucleotidyltransferase
MAALDFRDPDIKSFFNLLEELNVKFILVGGFAVAFHGYVRATSDLDLWLRSDLENIERFKSVLTRSGVKGLEQLRSFEMIPGVTQFQIGDSGFVVEPFKSLKTLSEFDFDKAYERAADGTFDGLRFKVIHATDLLREKEAINRPKDQGDIEHLRSLE